MVFVYGCDSWTLILSEKHRLKHRFISKEWKLCSYKLQTKLRYLCFCWLILQNTPYTLCV